MAEFPHFSGQEGEVVVALFESVLTGSERCHMMAVWFKRRGVVSLVSFLLSYWLDEVIDIRWV